MYARMHAYVYVYKKTYVRRCGEGVLGVLWGAGVVGGCGWGCVVGGGVVGGVGGVGGGWWVVGGGVAPQRGRPGFHFLLGEQAFLSNFSSKLTIAWRVVGGGWWGGVGGGVAHRGPGGERGQVFIFCWGSRLFFAIFLPNLPLPCKNAFGPVGCVGGFPGPVGSVGKMRQMRQTHTRGMC